MKISAISNLNYQINSNLNINNQQKSPNFGQFRATESLIKEFAASGIPAESFAEFKQLDTKSLSKKILTYKVSQDLKRLYETFKSSVNTKLAVNEFSGKEISDVLNSDVKNFWTEFSEGYKSRINEIFAKNGSDFDIYVSRIDYSDNSKNYLNAVVPGLGGVNIKMQNNEDMKGKMEQIIPTLKEITDEKFVIHTGNSADLTHNNTSKAVQNMISDYQVTTKSLNEQVNQILCPIIEKRKAIKEAECDPYRFLM